MKAKAKWLLGEVLQLPASERLELFERLRARLAAEHGEPLPGPSREEIADRRAPADVGETK